MDEEQKKLLEAAEDKLRVAKKLFSQEELADSVSRSYYGMFHAARAMLIEKESRPKTHQGVVSELGKLFRDRINPDLISEMSQIQGLREDADYEPYFKVEKQRAEEVLQTAEELINQIREELEAKN